MEKRTVALWGEYGLTGFKYLLALFMMLAGVLTAIGPITPLDGDLGFLYSSRWHLIFYGAVFFGSGAALFWGKIRRSRKWTGIGLMAVYLCFMFGATLNFMVWGTGVPSAWVGNLVAAAIVGVLYLRWRFQTEYVDPNHFMRDLDYRPPRDDDERN